MNTRSGFPDNDRETGLGDFNVIAAYLLDTGNPAK